MIQVSGPTTLTVSWSAPLLYPGVVDWYIVRCSPESDSSNIEELIRGPTRFNAPFHNLIPNTTYNCEVHTTSSFGNSTPATASASTLPRESKSVVYPLLFYVKLMKLYITSSVHKVFSWTSWFLEFKSSETQLPYAMCCNFYFF